MKILAKKIGTSPKDIDFSITESNPKIEMRLSGKIYRTKQNLLKLDAQMSGELELIDDIDGEEYIQSIDESLVLYISEGIWDIQSQEEFDSLDVIEFFDGYCDIEYILRSEIESIKADYHTKHKKGV